MEERSPCHHNLGQSRGVRGLILPSFSLEPLQPLIMSQQALLKFLSHSPYRPVLPTGRLQQSLPQCIYSLLHAEQSQLSYPVLIGEVLLTSDSLSGSL